MIRLFLILIFVASNAWAYTPPIGIPDPGMWGTTHPIDSVAPDTAYKCPSWPSGATANCYYIDNSTTCSDATNGSPANPRCTIQSKTYSAGSYIEVHGGPYTVNTTLYLKGTADNPIWLRGRSYLDKPLFTTGTIFIIDSSYTIIENLEFYGLFPKGNAMKIGGTASNNICTRNNYFHDFIYPNTRTCVLGSTPTQGGSIHDLVYYNNIFDTIGDSSADYDQDYHAINPDLWGRTPPTTQYNVWSLSNVGNKVAGSLNQFNGDQRDAAAGLAEIPPRDIFHTNLQNFHHMYSGKNISHHSRQSIGAPKFTTDAVYSQNEIYNNFYNNTTLGDSGTGPTFQEGSRYVWFLFNKIYNECYGIRSSNTAFGSASIDDERAADLRAYMIGNLIYNMNNAVIPIYYRADYAAKPSQGILFQRALYTRSIIDNTIYNVGGGINIAEQLIGDSTTISGNVIAGVKGIDDFGTADYHITALGEDISSVFINYNFFEPREDNGKVSFYLKHTTPTVIMNSITELQSSSIAQCTNCWSGDPLFVDKDNYDLHPQAGSPLIGKGIRHPVYQEFYERYGIEIDYDFDGNKRPATDWTLGAYEYNTGYIPPVDVDSPVITQFSMPESTTSFSVPVTITTTDNVGVRGYLLKESSTPPLATDPAWVTIKPTLYAFGSIGSKTLYLWVKDAANNISAMATATTNITEVLGDTEAPVVTAFSVPPTSNNLTVPVTMAATDNVAVVAYQVNESAIKPLATGGLWTPTPSYAALTEGTKVLYGWAKDSSGNVSNSLNGTVTITLDPISPPRVGIPLTGSGSASLNGSGSVIIGQ